MSNPLTDLVAAEKFSRDNAWNPRRIQESIKPICRACVHDSCGVGFHQCSAKAKTQTADGFWWCHVHEPAAFARREAKKEAAFKAQNAKWEALAAAQAERERKAAAFGVFLTALRAIEAGDNDPRATARAALGDYLEGGE